METNGLNVKQILNAAELSSLAYKAGGEGGAKPGKLAFLLTRYDSSLVSSSAKLKYKYNAENKGTIDIAILPMQSQVY